MDQERITFETWLAAQHAHHSVPFEEVNRKLPNGAYAHGHIQSNWIGWQARAALQPYRH